jgi:hypothetical protein
LAADEALPAAASTLASSVALRTLTVLSSCVVACVSAATSVIRPLADSGMRTPGKIDLGQVASGKSVVLDHHRLGGDQVRRHLGVGPATKSVGLLHVSAAGHLGGLRFGLETEGFVGRLLRLLGLGACRGGGRRSLLRRLAGRFLRRALAVLAMTALVAAATCACVADWAAALAWSDADWADCCASPARVAAASA